MVVIQSKKLFPLVLINPDIDTQKFRRAMRRGYSRNSTAAAVLPLRSYFNVLLNFLTSISHWLILHEN